MYMYMYLLFIGNFVLEKYWDSYIWYDLFVFFALAFEYFYSVHSCTCIMCGLLFFFVHTVDFIWGKIVNTKS